MDNSSLSRLIPERLAFSIAFDSSVTSVTNPADAAAKLPDLICFSIFLMPSANFFVASIASILAITIFLAASASASAKVLPNSTPPKAAASPAAIRPIITTGQPTIAAAATISPLPKSANAVNTTPTTAPIFLPSAALASSSAFAIATERLPLLIAASLALAAAFSCECAHATAAAVIRRPPAAIPPPAVISLSPNNIKPMVAPIIMPLKS